MGYVIKLDPERVVSAIIQQTVDVLRAGGVILYPTETVYGFGCDARKADAIERIFKIKKRQNDKPFLLLAHNTKMVKECVDEIPAPALRLIDAFWPGPLTVLLPANNTMNPLLIGPNGKIGVRVPSHTYCLKVLAAYRSPIVSTSANISGAVEQTSVDELKMRFRDSVDLIVDAGEIESQVPSTVIDVSQEAWNIVREGRISRRDIEKVMRR